MDGRLARDDEVTTWRDDGWVVLDGLVGAETIDAALDDIFTYRIFPRPERFHADPDKYIPAGRTTADLRFGYPEMPEHGPAFRPEQHRWGREFPFFCSGALNRLYVHPAIIDFAERVLETPDVRLYQAQVSAKYQGDADYEQPMHTDRNHSYLPPPPSGRPFWHVEMFLFLCDVEDDLMPTHFVSRPDSGDYSVNNTYVPETAPELFARERGATGVRGSLLAYRSDTFHRAVNMTRPLGARFLLNVSYKVAGLDWVGYHTVQSKASHPGWVQFVEESTPRELEVFGFPPPGDPVWTEDLIDATTEKYPKLDVAPWRAALRR
jgi:hypothetical protein